MLKAVDLVSVRWYLQAFRVKKLSLLLGILLGLWLFGAGVIWMAERDEAASPFNSYTHALWCSTVYLVSGLDEEPPATTVAKLTTVFMMLVPAGVLVLLGTFCMATFSRLQLLAGHVKICPEDTTFKDHIVICGWNTKGDAVIRQLHADQFEQGTMRRPIVIVSEQADSIPITNTKAYQGVWAINDDPVQDPVLEFKACVKTAHSVIILADETAGKAGGADAATVLISLAIQTICPNTWTCAEILDHRNEIHFERTAVTELVSVRNIAGKLVARAAQQHNLTKLFMDLLEVSRDTNEVYILTVPKQLVGQTFEQAHAIVRKTKRPEMVLAGVQTSGTKKRHGEVVKDNFDNEIRTKVLTVNPPREGREMDSEMSTRFFSAQAFDDERVSRDHKLSSDDRLVIIAREEPDLSILAKEHTE